LGIEKYKYSGKEYKIVSLPFYLLERWEEFITKDNFIAEFV